MSIALGNKKPKQLLEVEKLVWRALFTLSEGTKAPEDVLSDLLLQIPWQSFQPQSISKDDSDWFMIQTTPVSTISIAPDQNILPSILHTSTSLLPSVPAVSDNNTTDSSPTQAPLPITSSLPDNNTMEESLDHQPPPPILNVSQPDEPESSASGITGFGRMDIDSSNVSQPTEPVSSATGKTDFVGFGCMDIDSPNDDPATEIEEEIFEAPIYRRSTRLALEKSKDDSLPSSTTPEINSCSTSPVEHHPTTAPNLKRKAPTHKLSSTGASHASAIDVDTQHAEKLLSPGGSRDKPIDVDALHAVLERYPVRREPQVCGSRSLNRDIADAFSSS